MTIKPNSALNEIGMKRRKEKIKKTLDEFLKENHDGQLLTAEELTKSLTSEIKKLMAELRLREG